MQELAWVAARFLAYVIASIIQAIASRNCVYRNSDTRLRLGAWLELDMTKVEKFDRTQ